MSERLEGRYYRSSLERECARARSRAHPPRDKSNLRQASGRETTGAGGGGYLWGGKKRNRNGVDWHWNFTRRVRHESLNSYRRRGVQ